MIGSACAVDDLVALVNKGNTDALLQQVGHGVLADEPNGKGQVALIAAGVPFITTWFLTVHFRCKVSV